MNTLKENIFFLKHQLIRSNPLVQYREAITNLSLSSDELVQLNWRKRKNLLWYVINHVPFYREYYQKRE